MRRITRARARYWVETAALIVFWLTLFGWRYASWPLDGILIVVCLGSALAWVKLRDRHTRVMKFNSPRDTYDDLRRWQDAGALTPNHQARTAIFRYVTDLRRAEHRHGPAQTITPPE